MEKKLRLLAVTTILGVVTIVVAFPAQGQFAAKGDQGSTAVRPLGGSVYAQGSGGTTYRHLGGETTKSHPYKNANSVIESLRWMMVTRQNALLRTQTDSKNNSVREDIIKANCYSILTTMASDEKQHEIHDVMHIDSWASKDAGWGAVCRAPSMVKELDKVDPAICAKIQSLMSKTNNASSQLINEASKRAMSTLGYVYMSPSEKARIFKKEVAKVDTKKNEVLIQKALTESIQSTRQLLTVAQKAEFDGFLSRHESSMKLALKGVGSFRISP